jgi:hypothetical protein
MTTDDDLDACVDTLLAFDEGEADVDAAWRALQTRTSDPSPRRARGWVVAALVVVAAAVFAVMWMRRPSASAGEVDATARQTVAIGHRGVAVVDPGAVMHWRVDEDGAAHVQQSAGAVFYRVNEGDAFVVETPAGRATVTGTCFTVEVEPMGNGIKLGASALAGAAGMATVMLTVHEGSVVLDNGAGRVEAEAGQRAHARAGSAPALGDAGDERRKGDSGPKVDNESRYSRLVRENIEQRRALRQMREALDAARRDGQSPPAATPDQDSPEVRRRIAQHCAVNGDCDERLWADPSVAELRELAKCGRILVDRPTFLQGDDFFPAGYVIESAGLSEGQAIRYAELAEELYKESGTKYAAFARELGVPAELIDRLAPHQLGGLIESIADDWEDTMHEVANERAQLSSPPQEQSPSQRALRYQWSLGDEFERRLAAEFGAQAAKEMRRAAGGWANKNTWAGRDCVE